MGSGKRYQTAHEMQCASGIAPVTRRSGKKCVVSMRQGCNERLRNAMYHWSRVSVQHDSVSREHYRRLRSVGHAHGRALRGVTDRLLAVLVAMLKSGQTDVSFLRCPPHDPNLIGELAWRETVSLVLPKDHRLAAAPVSLADLPKTLT